LVYFHTTCFIRSCVGQSLCLRVIQNVNNYMNNFSLECDWQFCKMFNIEWTNCITVQLSHLLAPFFFEMYLKLCIHEWWTFILHNKVEGLSHTFSSLVSYFLLYLVISIMKSLLNNGLETNNIWLMNHNLKNAIILWWLW